MPTAPPTIDPVPTPVPTTADPANFDARADAVLAWFPDGVDAIQDVADNVYDNAVEVADSAATVVAAGLAAVTATDYLAISTSILTVDAGSKTVHLSGVDPLDPPTFAVDDLVVIIYRPDPTIRLFGSVTAWDGLDDMTVSVDAAGVIGTGGPFANWLVMSASFFASGATAQELFEGTSDTAPMTPATVYQALGTEVVLADVATIVVDMATFINAKVTLGGNRTLGNPTNPKPGQTGRIRPIQDATGSRTLSFANRWFREGGAPALTTTPNHWDVIEYDVISSTIILYDLIRDPT